MMDQNECNKDTAVHLTALVRLYEDEAKAHRARIAGLERILESAIGPERMMVVRAELQAEADRQLELS